MTCRFDERLGDWEMLDGETSDVRCQMSKFESGDER